MTTVKRVGLVTLLVGLLLSFTLSLNYPLKAASRLQTSLPGCPVKLKFDQNGVLPSASGLTYFSTPNNVAENSVFSVDNGMLHLNSLGTGALAVYKIDNAYDPKKNLVLEFRMKVYPGTGDYGVDFEVSDAVKDFEVGFKENGIILPAAGGQHPFLPFNTTDGFHIYKLVVKAGSSKYKLFIDNVQMASNTISGGDPGNRFVFGDGTPSGGDGRADIDYIRYCNKAN